MSNPRKAYPSDVSDDVWALVAPYLILLPETASQRTHALREVFNDLRYIVKTGAPWRWMPNDLDRVRSSDRARTDAVEHGANGIVQAIAICAAWLRH